MKAEGRLQFMKFFFRAVSLKQFFKNTLFN